MTKKGRNRIKYQAYNKQSLLDLKVCYDEVLENKIKYPNFIKENLLDDNYPVYYDYIYFADENIVRSDIQGTVCDLKKDLISQGKNIENIYSVRWEF